MSAITCGYYWSDHGVDYSISARQASVPNRHSLVYFWNYKSAPGVVQEGEHPQSQHKVSEGDIVEEDRPMVQSGQSHSQIQHDVVAEIGPEEDGRQGVVPSYTEAPKIRLIKPDKYRGATVGDIKVFNDTLQDERGIEDLMNSVTPQMNTVLHVAASFGQVKIVELVHRHCPSLDMRTNSRRDTALHHAARDGHLSVVKFLINTFTGDIETGNAVVSKRLLRMKNVDGNTALHEATRNGHLEIAQLLIKEDHELANLVNNAGESPFYLAALAGLSMLVRQLLKMPVDHMIQEPQERKTALHAAIAQEHTDTVKILLEQAPRLKEIRDINERSPLHYAAYCGYHQVITLLLERDVSIAHHRDKDGMSPIHLASIHGHLTVFQELLKHCPDSRELLNNKFQNALHVASESRRDNMVTFVLETRELEKLINERDSDGNTPLHLATRHGHATTVSILVRDKRVDLTIKNNEGHTAYDVAQMHASDATSNFSFRKILSAVALRSADAPRRHRRLFFRKLVQETPGDEKATTESFRDRISTLVLVATLIITITFAAGLVVPGEDKNGDAGKEKTSLLLNSAFHVYVISNTIAMYSSIVAAIMLIWAHLGDFNLLDFALRWSMKILAVALTMLAVTFSAGVYLVVSNFAWLATAILITSIVYLFCILALFIPLQAPIIPRHRWMGFISKYTLSFLLFATGFEPRQWLISD